MILIGDIMATGYIKLSINGISFTLQKDGVMVNYRFSKGEFNYEFLEIGATDLSIIMTIHPNDTIIIEKQSPYLGMRENTERKTFGSLQEFYTFLKEQKNLGIKEISAR